MSTGPHLQYYKTDQVIQSCTIGILPFINKSTFTQGDKIFYRILLTQLVQQQSGRVLLEGDILALYRQLHLRPWVHPSPEQLQIIGSRLGADILIGGEILEMREPTEGGHTNPHVKLQLNVYSSTTGTLLWSTYHTRQGSDYRKVMHFGLSSTVSQLGTNIIEEILELWKDEALLHCQN